jgi:hypothetical protein
MSPENKTAFCLRKKSNPNAWRSEIPEDDVTKWLTTFQKDIVKMRSMQGLRMNFSENYLSGSTKANQTSVLGF